MVFKENLKTIRKEKHISQEALAKYLDVSIKTISHWETGYSEPSIAQLIQIADFFDVSLDFLLGRTDI